MAWPRLDRVCDTRVSLADSRGRAGYGHRRRDAAVLHVHLRGGTAGLADWCDGGGRRDLRARHGPTDQVKIIELAPNIITLSGYAPDVGIDIESTGRRRGQRLFAELGSDTGERLETRYPRILIGYLSLFSEERFLEGMAHLQQISRPAHGETLRGYLQELLPEAEFDLAPRVMTHAFIYVRGSVRDPGSFLLREPITLLQAISLAGGLGERAKHSILILRNKPEGG